MQITDRSKDVIKSGGEWISSIDLENAAVGFPAVHEAAVIGVFHAKWQERPLLLVIPKPGQTVEDRKSVVSGKSVSVRVDLGGRRIIKKQQKQTEFAVCYH